MIIKNKRDLFIYVKANTDNQNNIWEALKTLGTHTGEANL